MADFDMDGAVADVAGSLGLNAPEPVVEGDDAPPEQAAPETQAQEVEQAKPAQEGEPQKVEPEKPVETGVRQVPKTWPKELHEAWTQTPPQVQEYWELREKQMRDGLQQYYDMAAVGRSMQQVVAPYQQIIEQAGLDAPKAVASLLAAHARLTQGSRESKWAAYQQLGQELGFVEDPTPPELKQVRQQVEQLQNALTQKEQAQYAEARQRTAAEVNAFAEEHPHFDEVSEEIIAFIKSGMTLEDAYERAIYANPVVREKELARLRTEAEKQALEKAKADAEKARKATATNVRSRDTGRLHTEPHGKMEDTMRETLREIRERTH